MSETASGGCPLDVPAPGWHWRRICDSESLAEGGDGVRFEVPGAGQPEPAFVVRARGEPRAFLNRCRHIPVELDWQPGKFFDGDGLYLVCSTHGAMYRAVDGRCVGGPCRGQSLVALQARDAAGAVWVAVQDGDS